MYAIWFLSTGILDGYLPEVGVMRYMSPHISQQDVEGYSAPYKHWPVNAKSSVYRFGHIVPGTPRIVLRGFMNTWQWKLCEGLFGPNNFDNLWAQARLSVRDDEVRRFWKKWEGTKPFKVAVVFGDRDPLLKGYKNLLVQAIDPELMVKWAPNGMWVEGGGHYPLEDKPEDVAFLIKRFVREVHSE
jgi:pimeloyl-ACP methyl ester carboxylesterase